MPLVRTATLLMEEHVDEDTILTFPNMSTCTAVVITVGDTMIGGHFTIDQATTVATQQKGTKKVIQRMLNRLGARKADRLTIVGFNTNHNPKVIAQALGFGSQGNYPNAAIEAYDIAGLVRGYGNTVLTFVSRGRDVTPQVDYKRESKTSRSELKTNPKMTSENLWDGRKYEVSINNTPHYLRRHFTDLRTQVG
ncbi:hypothetical protein V8J88_05615 [Massilia sp. W12]|uniref:hypothetical protein n=1 Tax=Massilia sp. W12 TaxID=3126507 RepID=UPI0030CE94B1